MKRFEDLIVWQKAHDFVLGVYKDFSDCRDYSFKDQLTRAAVSIMNNIAEGFERNNDKEFRRFLIISKGSAGEARSMLYLAPKLGYINDVNQRQLNNKALELSFMIASLLRKMRI